MSHLIRVVNGSFGRVSTLVLGHHLVEHAHADSHFQYWLGGSLKPVSVDGKSTPFDQNNAVAINSWQPHASPTYERGEYSKFLLLYLDSEWLAQVCAPIGKPSVFPVSSFPYTQEIQHYATELADYLASRKTVCLADTESRLKILVQKSVLSVYADQHRKILLTAPAAIDRRIDRAIRFMRSNLSVRMTMGEVARAAGLSRPHFFALFKQQISMSPKIYWNTVRMESAINLLAASELPLADLAFEMGFSEPANFTRFFKMHSGVCPSSYRHAVEHHSLLVN